VRFDDESDLDRVPVVNDFAVDLADPVDEGGRHLQFVSMGRGRLAGFPAWDHADRDLRHFVASDVPLGTIEEPFEEEDDHWRIVIFERGGYVYVLEGRSPLAEEFPVAFKVPRDQYLAAWAFVIDAFNPITPLDDTDKAGI
jgi:hypothetical protein